MKRIAIIEMAHCHEEVILPQVELLRDAYDVHVVAPRSLLDVDLLRRTSSTFTGHAFTDDPPRSGIARLARVPALLAALGRTLRGIGPDLLLFNSTYTPFEVALIHAVFRRYRKVRIVHDFSRCLSPVGRRLYNGFDGNLVLSEHVHAHIRRFHPEFGRLDYFLPIFFGSFLAAAGVRPPAAPTPGAPVTLGVFGSCGGWRRNYNGLLRALRETDRADLDGRFRICIAGRATPEILAFVAEHRLGSVVECFPEIVPFDRMFAILQATDLVLFLIDRDVPDIDRYNRLKITGTSTLMKAFRKAGVTSTDFEIDGSLADKCFTYPGTDVGSFLRDVAAGRITSADAAARAQSYDGRGLLSLPFQRERLTRFLERACAGRNVG